MHESRNRSSDGCGGDDGADCPRLERRFLRAHLRIQIITRHQIAFGGRNFLVHFPVQRFNQISCSVLLDARFEQGFVKRDSI